MEKKKSILVGTILAGAVISVSGLTAGATGLFNYSNLGTADEIRSTITGSRIVGNKSIDLKCGNNEADSASVKTDKECKCDKGKCSEDKCGEGKCGKGKCGKKHAKKGKAKSSVLKAKEVKKQEAKPNEKVN